MKHYGLNLLASVVIYALGMTMVVVLDGIFRGLMEGSAWYYPIAFVGAILWGAGTFALSMRVFYRLERRRTRKEGRP